MIHVHFRLGFGFDIESSEDICHVLENDQDDEKVVVAFQGLLIRVPFFTIYIGDFLELE